MKTYLVTGAAGFIGADYLKYILAKHDDIRVVVLAALTYSYFLSFKTGIFMISRLDQIFFFCISTNSITYSVFHGGRWLQPSTVPHPEPAIKLSLIHISRFPTGRKY